MNPRAQDREGNSVWEKEVNLQNFWIGGASIAWLVLVRLLRILEQTKVLYDKILSIYLPDGTNIPSLADRPPYWIIVHEITCHIFTIAFSVLSYRVINRLTFDLFAEQSRCMALPVLTEVRAAWLKYFNGIQAYWLVHYGTNYRRKNIQKTTQNSYS